MKLKVGDTVKLRNGAGAQILADDLCGERPLAVRYWERGVERVDSYLADGSRYKDSESSQDLVKVRDIRVSYFTYRRNPSGGVTLGGYFSDTVEETRRLLNATWDGVAKVTTTDGALSSIEIIK